MGSRNKTYGGRVPVAEQIELRVFLYPDKECWEPLIGSTNGYWDVSVAGEKWLAHRYAFFLYYGYEPSEVAHHTCGNGSKGCWNPQHLVPETLAENSGMARRGYHKTICKNGHPMEGENLKEYRGRRSCSTCNKLRLEKFYAKPRA